MWQVMFQVIPVLAWGVSALVVVRPLALPRRAALLAVAALGVAFGKFAFFAIAGGNGFTPDLPPLVIWAYGWAYGAAMILTMLSFAAAVLDGVARVCRRPVPVRHEGAPADGDRL